MAGRFFICGLPRSRTAWFAVATCTQTSLCYHEITKDVSSFTELADMWAPKYGVDVGVSDSALALQAGRVLAELKPKTLIVERPVDECLKSYQRYAEAAGWPTNPDATRELFESMVGALEAIKSDPLVLSVPYDELRTRAGVAKCLQWLLPGREFPDLQMLMGMNIQVMPVVVEAAIKRGHNMWHTQPA